MTPTEQARRSDALYYGTVSRRELCDRIARLEDACTELAGHVSDDVLLRKARILGLEPDAKE